MQRCEPRVRESGRLLELSLILVGISIALAILFPLAARSGHPWLPWLVLGIYGAVLLFFFWALRGWGRMAATLLTGLGLAAHRWVPAELRIWFLVSIPLVFALGWVVDWRLRIRWRAEAARSNGGDRTVRAP